MTEFLQLHMLTAYGASNLNRDDSGRPKSVSFGGTQRLRISSQCLKRTWRTSDVFHAKLEGHLAWRTQRLGKEIVDKLTARGLSDEDATKIAQSVAQIFGKVKKSKDKTSTFTEQLAFISPEEQEKAFRWAEDALAEGLVEPKPDDILLKADSAADIAMFGRMFADTPKFNREAAVQIAHAFTTHQAVAEDDYYTALDDLKSQDELEDAGAGFIGVQEFGAGVFYCYMCIDKNLLRQNLNDSATIANSSISALIEAATTVAPQGKQSSFASRARSLYVLAEKGTEQPRSLAAAFLKPIRGQNQFVESVRALESFRDQLSDTYGDSSTSSYTMNIEDKKSSLKDLIEFSVS
ncbi:MAG: type I-E CRISPR-associated protein Cas7/Cse4/CasC [Gammaproteobacteria bacterium]|nr:type I-E CRISPR-associated protein Cas7/Cse4/CasC [Gammaproteobacteria bacterium]MYF53502.1 type I-E CRISPR-associated protein Cas7/Cse4/CasC [Gammaproteobacteria bacterium]MYK44216.1 type I-E CRISPR-associated protein Cas7/Cse4/CasC [Gammaproteobacteria bacterium]